MNKRKVASVTGMRYLNSCGEPARSGCRAPTNPLATGHSNSLQPYIPCPLLFFLLFFVVVCYGSVQWCCVLWLCVVDVCCGCVLWLCLCGCVFVVVFVAICLWLCAVVVCSGVVRCGWVL